MCREYASVLERRVYSCEREHKRVLKMTFEELYFSKSKYSQRVIDIKIGKKSINPLYDRFLSKYLNWVCRFEKKFDDFQSLEKYREYLISRPKINVYDKFFESYSQRFSEEELEIIKAENERQRILYSIRRKEMYKNEYDFQNIPKETKEYLQLIEVLIMKKLGFNITAIGNEMNKSFAWVAKRYGRRIKYDNQFNNHMNNLRAISMEISNLIGDKSSGYNYIIDDLILKALNKDGPKATIYCDLELCKRGCIGIIRELEFRDNYRGQEISINIQENFCRTFRECICQLKPREVLILDRYYGCSKSRETYKAIAQSQNVSPERIRQLKCKAIRKMRHPSRLKRLMKEYFLKEQ